MTRPNKRVITGRVKQKSGDKTVRILVTKRQRHPMYNKIVNVSKSYLAHDVLGADVGDLVEIIDSRKLSKTKSKVVKRIVEKAVTLEV